MTKIIVFCLGLVLIGLIIWWFLLPHATTTATAQVQDQQQVVDVQVAGGYDPETVVLRQGIPAVLNFRRSDPSSCLDHVVFPDFGINQALPQNQVVPIKIDTQTAGEYSWACGMDMFHGKLIIQAAQEE
ncbi:Copper-exporting ATPase [Bombilactobacillus mellifer]|uniref:Copper-exporting ATPase n=1 Tax=Bombilactobacillus mellifer TaxID=1218492 RepID=A0A0F4LXV4_9LACO|nr:cupredoxin domain-containing protein [Bombilactobacillus mellifer]KJY63183.1 Copper-exporting ATPase [Bombilactobacillus mellifer]MCT6895039.1 cupredoxin domain-containing protein [Bombilactobacillus mellifer]